MSFLDSEDDGEEAGNGETGDEENVVSYSFAAKGTGPPPIGRSSNCFTNLTYHRDTNELFMTFRDGRQYIIEEFPEIEFERWIGSASVGEYFNDFIRGNY